MTMRTTNPHNAGMTADMVESGRPRRELKVHLKTTDIQHRELGVFRACDSTVRNSPWDVGVRKLADVTCGRCLRTIHAAEARRTT